MAKVATSRISTRQSNFVSPLKDSFLLKELRHVAPISEKPYIVGYKGFESVLAQIKIVLAGKAGVGPFRNC